MTFRIYNKGGVDRDNKEKKKKMGGQERERERHNIVEFLNCYYNMLSL